jgi:hypothetical protein
MLRAGQYHDATARRRMLPNDLVCEDTREKLDARFVAETHAPEEHARVICTEAHSTLAARTASCVRAVIG